MTTIRSRTAALGVGLLAATTAVPLSMATAATPQAPDLSVLGDTVDALTTTLDTRAVKDAVAPTSRTTAALSRLLSSADGTARATWDERFGTLRTLRSDQHLTGPASGAATSVARGWLRAHAEAFGLTAGQVDDLAVVRDHSLPGTGTHVVGFVQTVSGVPSARGGRLTVSVTRDGRILSYAGDPTPAGCARGGLGAR